MQYITGMFGFTIGQYYGGCFSTHSEAKICRQVLCVFLKHGSTKKGTDHLNQSRYKYGVDS